MNAQPTEPTVIPFQKTPTFKDRPLMVSELFFFIVIASEAAREEGVPFEQMLVEVLLDELQGQ